MDTINVPDGMINSCIRQYNRDANIRRTLNIDTEKYIDDIVTNAIINHLVKEGYLSHYVSIDFDQRLKENVRMSTLYQAVRILVIEGAK